MVSGAIVGSAFDQRAIEALAIRSDTVTTAYGAVALYRVEETGAVVLPRHGVEHEYLPHQIPYRAHAAALAALGVSRLLITSSVGVLDAQTPLHVPLLVHDVLMLDNRLPDGSACTMFVEPAPGQPHLVLREGLVSRALAEQARRLCLDIGAPIAREVLFGYVAGPRTKTAAENALWRRLGADVNSMTLAPELVLANELGICAAAVAVGHKYSLAEPTAVRAAEPIGASLEAGRTLLRALVLAFLARSEPVAFGNELFRF